MNLKKKMLIYYDKSNNIHNDLASFFRFDKTRLSNVKRL